MTQNTTTTSNGSRLMRVISATLGGTLLTVGLRRRSLGGAVLALAGGWLLYRGVSRGDRQSEQHHSAPLDLPASDESQGAQTPSGATVQRSVTVGKSADELAHYWRDPELLTEIVGTFAEVTSADEEHLRWTVTAPLGRSIEWETELVEERPGELLHWKSSEDAMVSNEWLVRFQPAPADRGTEVTLELRFDPPGGTVGQTAIELLGVVPETLAEKALDRFKSFAETGEVPTLERNPSARGSGDRI